MLETTNIMAIIKKSLGKKIARLRKERGLSQEKLGWEVGINRGYIGFIERGLRNPSVPALMKLAKALKVSLDGLFRN